MSFGAVGVGALAERIRDAPVEKLILPGGCISWRHPKSWLRLKRHAVAGGSFGTRATFTAFQELGLLA